MGQLELALCQPSPNKQQAAFTKADESFTQLVVSRGRYASRASIALNYMPLYKKQASGETYGSATLSNLYRGLGSHCLTAATEGFQNPTLYKALFMCVAAGLQDPDYVIFPTSPREVKFGLDAYRIDDGLKIPMQLKSSENASPKGKSKVQYPGVIKTTSVYVRNILYSTVHQVYGSEEWDTTKQDSQVKLPLENLQPLLSFTADTLVSDAEGVSLPEIDASYVSTLQNAVKEKIDLVTNRHRQIYKI